MGLSGLWYVCGWVGGVTSMRRLGWAGSGTVDLLLLLLQMQGVR